MEWVSKVPLATTIRQTREVWQDFDARQKRYAIAASVVTLGRLGLRYAVEHSYDKGNLSRRQAALAHAVIDLADNIDGRIARAGNASTPWGQVIDPLADKVDFFMQEAARVRRGEMSAPEVAARGTRDVASTYVRHLETELYEQGVTEKSHAGAVWAGKVSSAFRSMSLRIGDLWPDSKAASASRKASTGLLVGSLGVNIRNYLRNKHSRGV